MLVCYLDPPYSPTHNPHEHLFARVVLACAALAHARGIGRGRMLADIVGGPVGLGTRRPVIYQAVSRLLPLSDNVATITRILYVPRTDITKSRDNLETVAQLSRDASCPGLVIRMLS